MYAEDVLVVFCLLLNTRPIKPYHVKLCIFL